MEQNNNTFLRMKRESTGMQRFGDKRKWCFLKREGQKNIPVYIFPNRMNTSNYTKLQSEFKDSPEKIILWQTIKQGYEYFENLRKLPQVTVDKQGL